jgi:hypothetical protein
MQAVAAEAVPVSMAVAAAKKVRVALMAKVAQEAADQASCLERPPR